MLDYQYFPDNHNWLYPIHLPQPSWCYMNRGEGFKNTDIARKAGKLGKKNSPWNKGPSCNTKKAAISAMKYRQSLKGETK